MARVSAANMKLLHPDWEYLFFDDQDVKRFIAEEFPQYQGIFDSFPYPIQRIDFFRYLAIYRMGGFYFDLDVFLCKDVSDLRNYDSIFPFEELSMNEFLDHEYGVNWEIGNYGFGATAGNSFLQRVIENCVRARRDPEWVKPMMSGIPKLLYPDFSVLNTTGPGLISRTLAELPAGAEKAVEILMPDDIYHEANWHKFGSYGVHLMEGSWHNRSDVWRRFAWWKLTRSMRLRNSIRHNGNNVRKPCSVPVPLADFTKAGPE